MRQRDFDHLLGLLTEASPRSVFLEVAFVESWVLALRRRGSLIPRDMVERSLPFFEKEFRWRPRVKAAAVVAQHAWARPLLTNTIAGVLAVAFLSINLG